jgi:hypothetical protein
MSITATDILLAWMADNFRLGDVIFSHQIQTEVPSYGRSVYGKMHTPATYDRRWRELREDKRYREIGVSRIVDVSSKYAKNEGAWELR